MKEDIVPAAHDGPDCRILIAPNAFKGSLSAADAAEAIARGFEAGPFQATCTLCPIADGGDGTAAILSRHFGAEPRQLKVRDPIGRPMEARYHFAPRMKTAFIDMATASGLALLRPDERDPLHADSFGTGELVRHALSAGARHILLGLGGTATIDGGAGLLRALGMRFIDPAGDELPPGGIGLRRLHKVDRSGLDPLLVGCRLTLLCDVDNSLLGPTGAARMFGKQKGADPAATVQIEGALAHLAGIIADQTGQDVSGLESSGAAGGAAAGLHAWLGAELRPGAEYLLDLLGFDRRLQEADLLVTGEGRLDPQTLGGKAPMAAARRARRLDVPVAVLAGAVPPDPDAEISAAFDLILPIAPGAVSTEEALRSASRDLERAAGMLSSALVLGRRLTVKQLD